MQKQTKETITREKILFGLSCAYFTYPNYRGNKLAKGANRMDTGTTYFGCSVIYSPLHAQDLKMKKLYEETMQIMIEAGNINGTFRPTKRIERQMRKYARVYFDEEGLGEAPSSDECDYLRLSGFKFLPIDITRSNEPYPNESRNEDRIELSCLEFKSLGQPLYIQRNIAISTSPATPSFVKREIDKMVSKKDKIRSKQ